VILATVWSTLLAPWQEAIDRQALLELALLGVAGGALGCWILFYDLSYGAESLAHALLPGLVLAALTGVPLVVGGALGLLVAATAIGTAARVPAIGRDTAVAVVVTALLGLGALMALAPATPAGLSTLLFGDVLGIGTADLVVAGVLAVVVLLALHLFHGRLLAVAFDRGNARALGARPAVADLAVLLLLCAALLVSVRALGNLLVVALLIGPAVTARLLTHRMAPMMAVAAAVAVGAAAGGLYLSYYAGTAAGASIAAALVAVYALASLGTAVLGR